MWETVGVSDPKREQEALAKRKRLMELVAAGEFVSDAIQMVGWSAAGYRAARHHHPEWAKHVDGFIAEAARTRGKTKHVGTVLKNIGKSVPPLENDPRLLTHADWSARFCHRRHLEHQVELAEVLDQTMPGEISMFLVWPGSGKSSTVLDWVTRRIAENPNEKILYVSESSDLTGDFVRQIQKRLRNEATDADDEGEDWSDLVDTYGPFYEKGQEKRGYRWLADRFRVVKATADAKDDTVVARAITSRAYGARANTLIVDDIQSAVTLTQTEKFLNILRKTYFTRGTAANPMRIVICGTRIGRGDIYDRLIEEGIVDRIVVRAAANYDGSATVPRAWCMSDPDVDKLTPDELAERAREAMAKERRRLGEDVWWALYQQAPVTHEQSTFGEALDGCLDDTRNFGKLAA